MDLDDWLRGERDWRTLFELLELLPFGGKYKTAVQMDRDIADAVLDSENGEESATPSKPSHPPLDGYTTLTSKLDDILDALMAIQATNAHSDPRKAGKVPRPRTMLEIRRNEREVEAVKQRAVELFGGY